MLDFSPTREGGLVEILSTFGELKTQGQLRGHDRIGR